VTKPHQASSRCRHPDRRKIRRLLIAVVAALPVGIACRGHVSKKPPVRVIRDMTRQAYVLPQTLAVTGNERSGKPRYLTETVAIEEPAELGPFETGKAGRGYVARAPIDVNTSTIARGKERFDIFCSGCHDRAGTGQGIVVQRGFPGPIELSSGNTRRMADGEIFSIITHGVRNMPPMGEQIPVSDRWPIVAWVRVLQRSQHTLLADVQPIDPSGILPEEREP